MRRSEPEHLLVALVEQPEGVVPEVLRKMSADPADIARTARELLAKMPQAYGGSQPSLSPRLKLVTDMAQAEADRLKDEYVSTEHLLVAIAAEAGRSAAARLLTERGLTRDKIFSGAHERARLAARDRVRIPKASTRRSSDTDATSRRSRARASSIRSSAATKRSGA